LSHCALVLESLHLGNLGVQWWLVGLVLFTELLLSLRCLSP
jgi:hypothetical protein